MSRWTRWDEEGLRKVTVTSEADGIQPAWVPGSHRLVFARRLARGEKMVLWIIDVEGKNLKQLTF